jgi:acyl-CoA synthetase
MLDPENSERSMPDGEVGEIGIRGASMMLGYFDDQVGTEACYSRAGWFLSGDLGVRDRHGNVKIVGRKKDLIIRGGRNIHPAEVEDLVMRHPAVGRAAAFPVPDERLGEKMCLVVVAKQGTGIEPQELLAHLARLGLSPYHMPEYFIQLDDLPLTATGKVLKRELAAMATDGRITPVPVC